MDFIALCGFMHFLLLVVLLLAPLLFPCRKRRGRKGHLVGCSPPKNPQGWDCSNRKEPQGAGTRRSYRRTPFWRIRGCLFDVSSPRRKTSEIRFGLRFLTVIGRLRRNSVQNPGKMTDFSLKNPSEASVAKNSQNSPCIVPGKRV